MKTVTYPSKYIHVKGLILFYIGSIVTFSIINFTLYHAVDNAFVISTEYVEYYNYRRIASFNDRTKKSYEVYDILSHLHKVNIRYYSDFEQGYLLVHSGSNYRINSSINGGCWDPECNMPYAFYRLSIFNQNTRIFTSNLVARNYKASKKFLNGTYPVIIDPNVDEDVITRFLNIAGRDFYSEMKQGTTSGELACVSDITNNCLIKLPFKEFVFNTAYELLAVKHNFIIPTHSISRLFSFIQNIFGLIINGILIATIVKFYLNAQD